MKKLIILTLATLPFLSCSKFKFENKIQGEWSMKQIKMHDQSVWFDVPENEQLVIISNDSVSNPWNKPYSIVDKHNININGTTINVDLSKNRMVWASNGDTIKFYR